MSNKKIIYIIFCILSFNAFSFLGENVDPQIEVVSISYDKQVELELVVRFDEGYYLSANRDFVNFELPESNRFKIDSVIYPEANAKDGEYYSGDIYFKLKLKQIDKSKTEPTIESLLMNYQFCDADGLCFFPDSKKVSVEIESGLQQESPKSGSGRIFYILLLAFIGGIILNVMPCVLPILSIKALSLVKQSNGSKKSIFINSLLYSLGILVTFLSLATLVALLKLAGNSVGWGFQFQNLGFNIFLTVLIFVFALSLFDLFIVNFQVGSKLTNSHSVYIGSFLSGIVAVLLATPCTAPLLGTALGFAFSQSIGYIFLIFILIGVGFSLPFLLLGIFPKIVQLLPKPGNWMNTFKEFMGFLLLVTSLFLLKTISSMMGLAYTFRFLFFLIILGFFLWVFGKVQKRGLKKSLRLSLYLVILALSIGSGVLLLGRPKEISQISVDKYEAYNRQKFDSELVELEIAAGKRVFLAFGANWCTTCKLNEARVLNNPKIVEFFADNDIVVYYGDFTKGSEEILAWLQRYDRAGVPFYLYYEDGEVEILPEILSMQKVYNLLD
ncbi:MAG: thioredoxin family protein [Spirochaetales bacterium]|nr:thioredoxin family protein [Spirochaetales bacterium]